jgi:hypothetical protein
VMSSYDVTGPISELAAVESRSEFFTWLLLLRSGFLLKLQKNVTILTNELRYIPIRLKVENPLGR